MRRIALPALTIVVAASGLFAPSASGWSLWERLESTDAPHPDLFSAIAYGEETFLASGSQYLFTSQDGWTWTEVRCTLPGSDCQIARRIHDVVWDGTSFIAIGNAGTDSVFRITEGRLEVAGACPPGGFRGIAYNGDRYVAVGFPAWATSDDAETWSWAHNPTLACPCFSDPVMLNSVTWTGSLWIAVGRGSCGAVVAISPDAESWTLQRIGDGELRSVASDGQLIVAVGDLPVASWDGDSWFTIPDLPTALEAVTWSGSRWYAAGAGGTVYSSPDGLQWDAEGPTNACLVDIAASEAVVIAVGPQAMTRHDPPDQWVDMFQRLPGPGPVVWDGTRFLATGRTVTTSRDGHAWQQLQCGAPPPGNDLAWDGRTYVAVGRIYFGYSGRSMPSMSTSIDGISWTTVELPSFDDPEGLRVIAAGQAGFVTIGDEVIGVSADGRSWEFLSFGFDTHDLVWNGAAYVALTASGSLVSSDGATWDGPFAVWDETLTDLPSHTPRLAAGNGALVAVQPDGRLAVSSDAVTWSPSSGLDADAQVADVVWTGVEWAAITVDERVYVSRDGRRWRRAEVPWAPSPWTPDPGVVKTRNRFTLAAGAGRVVAIADGLTLVQDRNPPPPRTPVGRQP